jgi:hypothetical protein
VRAGEFAPEEEVQAVSFRTQPATHLEPAFTHRWLESKPVLLTGLALIAVLIGGMIEIIPMIVLKENVPTIASVKPYTPLELLGRDIYIREGCVGCHSQMIRLYWMPVQYALGPCPDQRLGEKKNEDENRKTCAGGKTAVSRCDGKQENRFDVKYKEKDSVDVVRGLELHPACRRGFQATFIVGVFDRAGLARRVKPCPKPRQNERRSRE